MQEADCLGLEQSSRSHELELEGGGEISLSEQGEIAGAASDQNSVLQEASQLKETDGNADVHQSIGPVDTSDRLLTSSLPVLEPLDVSHDVTNKVGKVVNVDPYYLEKSEILSGIGDLGNKWPEQRQVDSMVPESCNRQYMPEESFIFVGKSHEVSPSLNAPNASEAYCMSSFVNGSPISLLQLIEVIRGLSEDEQRLLLKSIGSVSNAELGNSLIALHHSLPGLLERLKEELFLATCARDILRLQLAEQSDLQTQYDCQFRQLNYEISVIRPSHKEACERNDDLAQALTQCMSELKSTVSEKEDLQQQSYLAKKEVDKFSARAYELQDILERSQSDLLSLSKESADCKDLVAALQVENENIRGILALHNQEREMILEKNNSCTHENDEPLMELAESKNLVASLEVEISNLSAALASVAEERNKLEGEMEYLAKGNRDLSMALSDSKDQVEALQSENANISGKLALVVQELEKLEEEKKHSVNESDRLSSELLIHKESSAKDHEDYMRLEVEIREMTMQLEQLTEENIYLNSSLDIHKAKLREIVASQTQILCPVGEDVNQLQSMELKSRARDNATVDELSHQIHGKRDGEANYCDMQKLLPSGLAESPLFKLPMQEIFDDPCGFLALKEHLDEAENVLQKLEKAIEDMHSNSAFWSKSTGKVAAPVVSKLIQAFESNVHNDGREANETVTTEDQSPVADPFSSTKEHTGCLKAVLEQLVLDVKNASSLFKVEQHNSYTVNLAIEELKAQFEALMEHTANLEATNVEVRLLYEAAKQQLFCVQEKIKELELLCETLKEEGSSLKEENLKLGGKLIESGSKINDLQSQLHKLQQSSDEMASMLHDQLENVQKESAERALTVEQEWVSTIGQIVRVIERLDISAGFLHTSTTLTGSDGSLDITGWVAASVDAAVSTIETMKKKLEAVCTDHEATLNLCKQANEECNHLLVKNELANDTLKKLYNELRKLVTDSSGSMEETDLIIQDQIFSGAVDYVMYETLMEQLANFMAERQQLQCINEKLNLDLMSQTNDIEILNSRCLDLSSIQKLIEEVEDVVKLDHTKMDPDVTPFSCLESLVPLLVCKYREVDEQVRSCRDGFGSKVTELSNLQETMHELNALKFQHENEILLLKEQLSHVEEALMATQTELQEKASEIEQSEQRVSSMREKLSIAVAKGKGLIVQRDSLKQSLAETSSELERCSQELQLKDARLHEVEAKLKPYSEAGERVEALESELSYIRNSATTLRESFLLKDSILQRIEEILEDLDLPEEFHARDTIQKVDWLARSAAGSSIPPTDWDQKSSVGVSYPDAGFAVMDAWKEDAQLSSSSGSADDMRRKHEDLQIKCYRLAEQNEMLEQSLMERNHLVQRWEEILDRINMPSQLRSKEPEHRIEWLGNALSDANHDRISLLQNIDKLENHCGSITADLEDSQKRIAYLDVELKDSRKRISDLEMEIRAVIHEREAVSERLDNLVVDHEKLSAQAVQLEIDNHKLQNEVTGLQEKLVEKNNNEERIDGEISRLQDLICDVLQDHGTIGPVSGGCSTECLEGLLRKLIENYTLVLVQCDAVKGQHAENSNANLVQQRTRDALNAEESEVSVLGSDLVKSEESNLDVLKKLEDTLSELILVKEERDSYMERQQLLTCEIETLNKKRLELQELLSQEEQKSASAREKLNVAVRKGKSLVQQRDGLKQSIEEMSTERDRLKSDVEHQDNALAEYEQKLRDLTTYHEKVEALESESLFLRNRLAETEHLLQDKGNTLTRILSSLESIDVSVEISDSDPVGKLVHIGKAWQDLHADLAASVQESRKSRRAAELLLAELKEVQDRNDDLQEELGKAAFELAELSKERDRVEAAKLEALSQLEGLSAVHSEEKTRQHSELVALKYAANQLGKSFSDIENLLAGVFSEELEFLRNLQTGMESYLKMPEANHALHVPIFSESDGSIFSKAKENFLSLEFSSETNVTENFDDISVAEICSYMQQLLKEMGAVKSISHEHSVALHEQADNLSTLMEIFHREMTSQKESLEFLKKDMESKEKQNEMEVVALHRNVALLYEACTSSLIQIENRKGEVMGNTMTAEDLGINLKPPAAVHTDSRLPYENDFSSEENVKTVAERLLLVVKDFTCLRDDVIEGNKNELKITLSNLRKELQEKDIERERICMDLVNQIKEAEAARASYSLDLQSSKIHVQDLEKRLEMMEGEQNFMEQRVKELEAGQALSTELEERVQSLTDVLAAKDQEIEALMHALDEEEVQMEAAISKIEQLEKVVQQKNLEIGNLEASRGKVLKRLSITVTKFDELHKFSEGLLTEVEKLQSQLHDRDGEISFLRQEITRCTNDVLIASQMSNRRNSDEIYELFIWLNSLISLVGTQDAKFEHGNEGHDYKDLLQKKITSILSELEDQRAIVQSRDALLQLERSKIEELRQRGETLERSLHEKESQLNTLKCVGDSGQPTAVVSEILEVEPVINKRAVPGPSAASQVRSLRKVNNDQVAIAIDTDLAGSSRLGDGDDDKVHGFKSLATSRIVPRFTRRVTDIIDGLWVSCDRALMQQPALRLAIIIYWAVLHALLATIVV
uniref:Uncharacterized protein n=1 Tax=Rhizophora mucronata TaxID=61149 RepID=A0A2P2JQV5_RHIMU